MSRQKPSTVMSALQRGNSELEKELSELRKSLRQEKEAKEQYKNIIDLCPDGTVIVDLKGRVAFCNKAFFAFTGFAREDIIGKKFTKLPHLQKTDIPRYIKIFNSLISGRRPKPFKVNWVHKDGTVHASEVCVGFLRRKKKISGIVAVARDLTKQQTALEVLNANEKKYSNLFHQSYDAIFIHDLYGNVLDVNSKAQELFGYEKSDLLALKIQDLHPKSEHSKSKKAFQIIGRKGFVEFECLFLKKNGDVFPAEVSASVFEVEGAKLIQGCVRDISDRKKAEAKLKESREMYRMLVETSPDAVTVTDLEGNITYVSQRTLQIHGYERVEEVIGKKAFTFISPEDHEKAAMNLKKTLEEGSVRDLEYRLVRKDGTKFIGELHASLIKDVNGEPKAFIAISRDITERKRAEQEMSESEKKFRSVVENASDAIYIITSRGFQYVNSAFEQLTGYTSNEVLEENFDFWGIIHPDDVKMIRDRENARKRGEKVPSRYEFRILAKDGSQKIVEPATVQIGNKGEFKVMGILRDVTERKCAEEKIKASLLEKDVLLREINHRVKNNMQIISSLLRLQSRTIREPHLVEMFKESQNRIRSMALIHEKLYQTEDFASINFAQYIRSLLVHLFHTYKVNPNIVRMRTDVEDVFLDISKAIPCGLIINELVSNSLKHAFPSNRKGEIAVRLSSNLRKTKILISDSGVGLPKDIDLREPETLGLQLVSDLVKQVDGKIRLERSEGTTFHISF
jgi:PAS domain S-box-containing protein